VTYQLAQAIAADHDTDVGRDVKNRAELGVTLG
jgi:hypothetical protein